MPTEPYKPLLNRDMSKVLPKVVIDFVSPLLQETINFATQVYQRCQTSKEGKPDEAYPSLAVYLHIIQMSDSIDVLISNGCAESASLLLRSAFEARLALEYMLEKNIKQRAISWMVKNIIGRIEELENFDPTHPKGKEFRNTFEREGIGKIATFPVIPNLSDAIRKLKENLEKPGYAEAYVEYTAMVKKGRKYPEWYSFFNGPKNLKELAEYQKQGYVYQTFYASWSRMSHVKDAAHLTLLLEDRTNVLGPIRNPMNSIHIGARALSVLLETTKLMINKYRPYESSKFDNWYGKEVRDKHIMLVRYEFDQMKWFYEKFVQQK